MQVIVAKGHCGLLPIQSIDTGLSLSELWEYEAVRPYKDMNTISHPYSCTQNETRHIVKTFENYYNSIKEYKKAPFILKIE